MIKIKKANGETVGGPVYDENKADELLEELQEQYNEDLHVTILR